jgi:hypothetical protein
LFLALIFWISFFLESKIGGWGDGACVCWSGFHQVTEGAIFSSPEVQCQQSFLWEQSLFPVYSKTNVAIMTLGFNYHPDLFAAGAVTVTKELAAAKLVLEHAVAQRNLTHAIAEQAQVFAEEAVQNWIQAHEVLADL